MNMQNMHLQAEPLDDVYGYCSTSHNRLVAHNMNQYYLHQLQLHMYSCACVHTLHTRGYTALEYRD